MMDITYRAIRAIGYGIVVGFAIFGVLCLLSKIARGECLANVHEVRAVHPGAYVTWHNVGGTLCYMEGDRSRRSTRQARKREGLGTAPRAMPEGSRTIEGRPNTSVRIAQSVEPAAHNRADIGSTPIADTPPPYGVAWFSSGWDWDVWRFWEPFFAARDAFYARQLAALPIVPIRVKVQKADAR